MIVALVAVVGAAFVYGGGSVLQAVGVRQSSTRVVPAADHLTGYLGEPLAWVVIGSALVGTYAYADALDHGDVGVVTATLWVAELLVPGAAGVAFLGGQVRSGWAIPAVLASAVAIGAIVALSRSAGISATDGTASVPAGLH